MSKHEDERKRRLAEALRHNLLRRKAQAREAHGADDGEGPTASTPGAADD